MSMTAVILFPIYLAITAGSLAEGEYQQASGLDISQSQSVRDCSETVLEFVIDGVRHQTNSDYCSSQSAADDQST